jgi:ABC-type sugar transport system ATPase subunit
MQGQVDRERGEVEVDEEKVMLKNRLETHEIGIRSVDQP